MEMQIIAHVHTDFPEKFGLPRQSGVVPSLSGVVVFEKEYAVVEAVRGLEEYSHLWILWGFSSGFASADEETPRTWSPTVRPPRLGGNRRMGVFATRSPNRPNPIGLSCVKLDSIHTENGQVVLHISGIDMMDGTPVYDIKPYLPHVDAVPDAVGGFASAVNGARLTVEDPADALAVFPADKKEALLAVLGEDPRPSYQEDPSRIYGFPYAGREVHFRVESDVLIVCDTQPIP